MHLDISDQYFSRLPPGLELDMAEFGGEYAADEEPEPEKFLVNVGVRVTFFGGEKKVVFGVVSVFPVETFGGVNS